MEISEYKLSPSSLHDFERSNSCPFKWKKKWLDREIEFVKTEPMMYGSYFEYHCIGGGPVSDGDIKELPLTRSGNKSAAHERIDKQIEIFKDLFNKDSDIYLGIKIDRCQTKVYDETTKGYIDIMGRDEEDNVCLIDLKLTGSLDNPATWGRLDHMDMMQFITYEMLFRKQFGIPFVRSFVLIFDYSPEMNRKLIELDISNNSIDRVITRYNDARNLMNEYSSSYWPTYPSKKECEDCPLKCKDKFKIETIKIEI